MAFFIVEVLEAVVKYVGMNIKNSFNSSFLFFILMFNLTSCNWLKQVGTGDFSGGEEIVTAGRSEIKLVATSENKFVPETIIARPGQTLKIKIINKLKNGPIAFSILKKDEDPIVNAFLGIQAGEASAWAPPQEHILVKSKLLGSSESQSLEIKLPKEPGEYAYISSYPGHVDYLKGYIKIELEKKKGEFVEL